MSAFYKIAYQVGFHPWEDLADHPPFADTLTRLIAREEGDGGPPFGRALDVGSGSGVWALAWPSVAGTSPASNSSQGRWRGHANAPQRPACRCGSSAPT